MTHVANTTSAFWTAWRTRQRLAGLGRLNRAFKSAVTLILALVFAAAGLYKINDPTIVSDYLVRVFSYRTIAGVQAIGYAELALALWLISGAGRKSAAMVAAGLFVGFAATHVYAAMGGVTASCGCLGADNWTQTIPTSGWVAINGALALAAGTLSITPRKNKPNAPNAPAMPHGAGENA